MNQLGKLLGSSPSRVAKIETADSSVSINLMTRSLIRMGASRKGVASYIAAPGRRHAAWVPRSFGSAAFAQRIHAAAAPSPTGRLFPLGDFVAIDTQGRYALFVSINLSSGVRYERVTVRCYRARVRGAVCSRE